MQQDALVEQLHSMLGIVLYMSLPPLIAAVVVGLVIGVLQAVGMWTLILAWAPVERPRSARARTRRMVSAKAPGLSASTR